MAETVDGDIPLIMNDPQITEEITKLRTIIEQVQGRPDLELHGLRERENGEWIGVFPKMRS
jgi:hypothetical protein